MEYTVTFESIGGDAVDNQLIEHGVNFAIPTVPAKVDLMFAGWYSDAALTEKWNFAEDEVISDTTLYATWGRVVTCE